MCSNYHLPDEAATGRFGLLLAQALTAEGGVILLEGDLGAGKTSLVRATLHGLGYEGRVVSPSYTLIEPYQLGSMRIFHMDLYRLSDAEELEYLGIRDINPDNDLLFVEWPCNGAGLLPPADLVLTLQDANPGRQLQVNAYSEKAQRWQQKIAENHRSVG